MKKEMKRFDENPKYKAFVNQRDEALERILRNNRIKITDITNKTFIDVMSLIQSRWPGLVAEPYNKSKIKQLEEQIDQVIGVAVQTIAWEQIMLRRAVYMLSHAGEAEAIAQTTGKTAKLNLGHNEIVKKSYKNLPDGTDLLRRIELYFQDIGKKIISAVNHALIFEDEPDEMLGRVFLALPKKRALPAKPVLKKVKKAKIAEAKKPKFTTNDDDKSGVEIGFGPRGGVSIQTPDWDQASWDHTIKQSNEDYIAIDRSPETFFDMKNPLSKQPIVSEIDETDKIYGWELEQQMTHDFVQSVREGQIDAANFAGINEFIWIAVLDQKTCQYCCEWRSGLLTSEIEKTLADDPELAEHCDVVVPPAHFNCRCGIAPVVIDLETIDSENISTKDFQDWLDGE